MVRVMLLTAPKAAEATGKSVKTIYAAISSGRLSSKRDGSGQKVVDVTELMRVYGPLRKVGSSDSKDRDSGHNVPKMLEIYKEEAAKHKRNSEILLSSNKSLREQNALLKELLNDARDREKMIRAEHERTMQIFQRLLPKAD